MCGWVGRESLSLSVLIMFACSEEIISCIGCANVSHPQPQHFLSLHIFKEFFVFLNQLLVSVKIS